MDQPEFEANICNRRLAREKACERGTIGFGFASHWLRKRREVKQNQSKRESTLIRNSIEIALYSRKSEGGFFVLSNPGNLTPKS